METKLFLDKKERRRIEGLDDGWMSDEAVFFFGGESDSLVECS
jgi:hypothetical protein